jgi:DNA-binding PadR family transcriptional regulator
MEYLMRYKPHRTLTPLALVVLGLLRERPMHPYEMQQTIRDEHTDQVIKLRAGSLYHTVERLQTLELITAIETARAGRRPERTVYAITEEGRDEFSANLRQIISRPDREYPIFGAAMELLDSLAPAEAAELLERRLVALQAEIAGGEQVEILLAKRGLPRVNVIELEYAQAMRRAELAWCQQLIEDIRAGTFHWQVPGAPNARKLEPHDGSE